MKTSVPLRKCTVVTAPDHTQTSVSGLVERGLHTPAFAALVRTSEWSNA